MFRTGASFFLASGTSQEETMNFGKIRLVCLGLAIVFGMTCGAAGMGNCPLNATILADGGAPLPPPVLVADGGAPLPPPSLMADGGAPLPPPSARAIQFQAAV
jgi:hypothetical protein